MTASPAGASPEGASPAGASPAGDSPAGASPSPTSKSKSSAPRFRRRTWQLLGLLAILIVLAGLVGVRVLTAAPASTQTIWQAITAGIKNDTVPKDVALEAFSYQYKVSIPGVTVPGGVDGADVPQDGSGPLRWVQNHWAELTADQQAVINKYIVPGPNDRVLHVDATKGLSAMPGAAANGRFADALPAARPVAGGAGPLDAPAAGLEDALAAELTKDIQHIGPRLGLPVIQKGFALWTNVTLTISDLTGGNTLMETIIAENGIGAVSPCNITVFKSAWDGESPTSNGGVSDRLHVLMTHEVIHCYQNVVFGDVDTAKAMASWITEGSAFWLAGNDTGIQEPSTVSQWTQGYFADPEKPLTNRSYDAVGYYALLDHLGRDIWKLMVPAWKAAASNAQRSNAYINVLRGDDKDVTDGWATSYLRQQPWGDPWIAYGFGLPDAAQVFRHPIAATTSAQTSTLLSRSNTVLSVNSADGQVVYVIASGTASAHDESGNAALSFQMRAFCVEGQCVCPDGTLLAGKTVTDGTMTLPFAVAVNAPSGGGDYAIASDKLEDACGKPKPKSTPAPAQPSGPCTGNCPKSNGDPHLLTTNGYRYDFQAAGEFTLLKSRDGSVEIQGRQEPYGTGGDISTNTAIAARVGSHRVGVYVTAAGLQAMVDGAAPDLGSPLDLGGGARLATYAKGYEIDFADGTKLWALSVGQWGINAVISASPALKADGVGLLGAVVPGGMGVPALPDGTYLPIAADKHARFTALYGRYADAWRVTDQTTLFDYDPGKSTASYTQKGYPTEKAQIQYSDLTSDQRAAGQSACSSVTDPQLLDDCVFDVAVSGDSGFVGAYQAEQGLVDPGIAVASPAPGPSAQAPGPSATAAVTSGAAAIGPATGIAGYAFGAGDRLYISAGEPNNTATLMLVDPQTGTIAAQVATPIATDVHYAAGSVWMPGLKIAANGNDCNVTRFDANSLAEIATVDVPCTFFGKPDIISDGTNLWFEDTSKYDLATSKGAVLTKLDPSTNQPDPSSSVPLPFINGYHRDGQGTLFYFDTTATTGYYRLAAGAAAFEKLADYGPPTNFAPTGIWQYDTAGHSARFISSSTSGSAPVTLDSSPVAGTADAVYVQESVPSGPDEIWRFPVDGSPQTRVAVVPIIGGSGADFSPDPEPITGTQGFVKLWLPSVGSGTTPTLYVDYVPLK